jgi:type I restriction-modification system DNA methylase subunit
LAVCLQQYNKEPGSPMPAPETIRQLVQRFDQHRDAYRLGKYNETQLRREFLDPFFEALGWDIFNRQGYSEAYKDVIHEDSLEIEGANKAPDYAFRVGGTRKFFVEAKKPAVNIEFNIHPAFQLRRYAWSAKLPLGILTDFEEFAVYDCRVKPDKEDKASTGRVMLFSYRDYVERWDEIASTFSHEAVLKGSFDSYAEGMKPKKGTTEVDDAFLIEIERWRDLLAKNIALRNPVSVRELNYAVQMTIDRIVFMRICEDRGVERDEQLKDIAAGRNIYENLCHLFQRADMRYNSGLFHFKNEKGQSSTADSLTPGLKIDDKVLQDILKNLYYPESPYVFREIPSDILGQVYERFLGKVIRLTAGHQAKVEEKPEVRKAGGVYYTPTYIVDYIVQNTVGKLLEGKTPKEAAKLKILDPACGSGTFPLGAYQYLLDWHLKWYTENDLEKSLTGRNPVIYQSRDGYQLTTAKKKEILLNNIFGVDIDAQAVEVTKLSLLLKVLEGESQETIGSQLLLLQERVLPDLGRNIKCGNSLIGPDYYDGHQLTMGFADDEERYRVNAFDWKGAFPQVFIQGGFDVVIGNPPYISVESTVKDVTHYYLSTYKTAFGRANTFALFLEKSFALLKGEGRCGYIVSNRLLSNAQLSGLRKFILDNSTIEKILTFKKAVFGAAVDTTVITFRKGYSSESHSIEILYGITDLENKQFETNRVSQITFQNNASYLFNAKQREDFSSIISKLRHSGINLEQICDVRDGIILGDIKDLLLSDSKIDKRYEKWLEGNEVARYSIAWTGRYICYDKTLAEEEMRRKLEKAKRTAKSSSDFDKINQSGVRLRTRDVFQQEKILTRQNAKRLIGVLDDGNNYFVKNSLHCSLLNDKSYNLRYILGIINSRLLDFYFQNAIGSTGEIFSQMKIAYITKLPIRPINFSDPAEKAMHDRMVSLVERMLQLHKRSPRTPQEQEMLKREIESTDRQIDTLVYELYGLTEEEIKIIES